MENRMPFEGHQSIFTNSLFPPIQRQDQDTASYVPWSQNTHDDHYGLFGCAPSSTRNRKPTDNADGDGETDLQGLVSNILDEADSQDSFYSDGILPTFYPVWSPKALREEMLQCFQSEAQTQHSHAFPLNCVSRESLAQGQSGDKDLQDFCHQSNGLTTSQQWLFNLSNTDRDSFATRPQKLPPGLPMPNITNTYLSQIQQSKYDNMPLDGEKGNSQPLNHFPDLSDVLNPENEMNNPSFYPYYEDHNSKSTKPINSEQYMPQDINQLVSSLQSFMASEHDSLCRGEFPNMHRQTAGMHHEDTMVEQWKITSPAMSTQRTPVMQTQKQLVREFGTAQIERNGGARNQTYKRDAFKDPAGVSPQNTEYFLPSKPLCGSFNLPNQYQNNMTMYRENTSINPYSKHHIQQAQLQNRVRPQVQREKRRMQMSGFLGEGFSERPLNSSNMRGGENSMVGAGNTQKLLSLVYPVNDPRRHSSVSINSTNLSSRATMPYRGPGMDMGDMMAANETAAFNPFVSEMMSCRGENTYRGMGSATTPSYVMNQGGPVIQLYFNLDECYEQWRCLEKERKRAEVILTNTFVGKRTAAVTNMNLPKPPPNPTRVDHLIVNQMREEAKVASLLDRMECLLIPLHVNIHTALNRHHMAICIAQARRKEEIGNMSKHQRQRAHLTEDRDTLLLVIALRDLTATTRKLRTALWCALQMILPKPVKSQDHHVPMEATDTERCPSPFEGYTFKL